MTDGQRGSRGLHQQEDHARPRDSPHKLRERASAGWINLLPPQPTWLEIIYPQHINSCCANISHMHVAGAFESSCYFLLTSELDERAPLL